jgi:hypothetical protein
MNTSKIESVPRYKDCILAYFSGKLYKAEIHYSTYEKELIAIKDTLKYRHDYLQGWKTKITIEHTSITYMLT